MASSEFALGVRIVLFGLATRTVCWGSAAGE